MYLSCFISFKLSRYIMCQILLRFGMSFQSVIITKFIKIDTVVSLLKRNDRQRDYSIHTNIANDNINIAQTNCTFTSHGHAAQCPTCEVTKFKKTVHEGVFSIFEVSEECKNDNITGHIQAVHVYSFVQIC